MVEAGIGDKSLHPYIVVKDFVQVGFVPDLDVVDAVPVSVVVVGEQVTFVALPSVGDTRRVNGAVRLVENAIQDAAAVGDSPVTLDWVESDPDMSTTDQTLLQGQLQILAKIQLDRSSDLEAFVAYEMALAFALVVDLGANCDREQTLMYGELKPVEELAIQHGCSGKG